MCAEELAACYRLTCVLPKTCSQITVHQDVTVFGKRVFTEVIKLKQSPLGDALIKRGRFGQRDRQTQREGCVKRQGRRQCEGWRDAAMSQEYPVRSEAGGGEAVSCRWWGVGEHHPAHTWTLAFWPPELRDSPFLVF